MIISHVQHMRLLFTVERICRAHAGNLFTSKDMQVTHDQFTVGFRTCVMRWVKYLSTPYVTGRGEMRVLPEGLHLRPAKCLFPRETYSLIMYRNFDISEQLFGTSSDFCESVGTFLSVPRFM